MAGENTLCNVHIATVNALEQAYARINALEKAISNIRETNDCIFKTLEAIEKRLPAKD